jgi:hypothetical protein
MSGKGNEANEKLDREIGAKYGHLIQPRQAQEAEAPEFKAAEEPRVSASMAEGIAEVLRAHKPSRWRSFTNENEILRCCGKDFGNATRKPSRDDSEKAWAEFAAHQAEVLAANGYGKLPEQKVPEVRYATLINGETELDEVVASNAYVHLEVMDDNHWWMKISAADTEVDVNLYTKRAKITATEDTYRRPE